MIPTVGFNMRKVTKGKVTIKLWDLGGQPRFRSMWERYCRGVNAIMYVQRRPSQHRLHASPVSNVAPSLLPGCHPLVSDE